MNNLEHVSGLTVYTPDVKRAEYNRFKAFLSQMAPSTEFIITPALLRLEQVLVATRSKYTFNFYENQGADRTLERKLNRNDLFMITDIALGIVKQDAVAGDYANFPVFTFPDGNYFSGAAGGVLEVDALHTIYNGRLNFLTKPVQRIENLLTYQLKFVPDSQTLLQAGTQLADEYPQFGPTEAERGFLKVQPNLILSGQENHQVELELGTGQATYIAGGIDDSGQAIDTSNVVVFFALGFEAKNAATAASRWSLGAF